LAATFDVLLPVLFDPAAAPARRFQQTSGMVMAKGVEDCSFYRWSRLTSLNEVGGDPSVFAVDVDEFHRAMTVRQRDWPHAMTTLSTHDTKRGEDVRARIAVLAELPGVWAAALDELLRLAPVPDPGFGSLLWQAVLGAWTPDHLPDLPDRLHGYAEKAMREAGDRTTWTEPDTAYEAAVHAAVDAVFESSDVRRVLTDLAARIDGPGRSNSLSAKLVAITMPGVPDVYQGSELWETSLVDPDNRRPVDFDHRADVLAGTDSDDAVEKLHVTCSALRLRRDRPGLFASYTPVAATGPAAGHVLAFDRGGAITVATRLPVGLETAGGWRDTALDLPEGRWHDLLTGSSTDGGLAGLLGVHPVALLVQEDG
jgi:(1->4)-alpha-D-glucan 1-alpha-D-glucosylmutase